MKKSTEKIVIAILIVIQTIVYIVVGTNKSYLHIDEAYSFGLANYERISIQDNPDFYNNWHSSNYYEDYLTVGEKDIANYKPVYENQKNDVHPPLYYLILRFAMGFSVGHFSKWTGIAVNIIIYAFITIFMYLILTQLFDNEKNGSIKAVILAFISSIILASLSNVIYIRMYALLTLEVLITTFLHIKLLKGKKIERKLLVCIGISALAGILTHYYYIFYLGFLYLVFLIKYLKEKKLNWLAYYTLTLVIAGVASLIIFPYSINHIFFGYRGQSVISKFENIGEMIRGIFEQLRNLNYYGFNNLLPLIVLVFIGIVIYKKICKKDKMAIDKDKKEILKMICIPSILFFIMASLGSPWNVLRYIVPVCSLIFVLVIYYLYKLLQTICTEKLSNTIISILFCMILVSPFVLKLEPELMYTDRKEFVEELKTSLNLPTIYFYDMQGISFLDDVYVFSKLDESYIANDIEINENNIQKIFEDKDISKGIIVFINGNQESTKIIDMVEKSLNFTNCEHLQTLTECNVYYIN